MKKLYYRTNYFTLVEIMVAMGVLAILMGFLFKFIIGAQEIWAASRNVAGLYDKAQITMRWLEEDMHAAMYQSDTEYPGRPVSFYIECNPSSNELQSINMVLCRRNVTGTEVYEATPVKYEIANGKLYRTEIPTLNDVFYPGAFPYSSPLSEDNVIQDGIDSFKIFTPHGVMNEKPPMVKIEMTLYDPEVVAEARRVSNTEAEKQLIDRHSRVFTKIIFLNR